MFRKIELLCDRHLQGIIVFVIGLVIGITIVRIVDTLKEQSKYRYAKEFFQDENCAIDIETRDFVDIRIDSVDYEYRTNDASHYVNLYPNGKNKKDFNHVVIRVKTVEVFAEYAIEEFQENQKSIAQRVIESVNRCQNIFMITKFKAVISFPNSEFRSLCITTE